MKKQLHIESNNYIAYRYAKLLKLHGKDVSAVSYYSNVLNDQANKCKNTERKPIIADIEELNKGISPIIPYQRIDSLENNRRITKITPDLRIDDDWIDTLVNFSRRYGREWILRGEEIKPYKKIVDFLSQNFFFDCDIIFGYGIAAIPPLLSSLKPYVPVAIEDLKEDVLSGTTLGKLIALAFRTAPHVILTSAKSVDILKALEIKEFTFLPYPIEEDHFKSHDNDEKLRLKNKYQVDHIILAPAVQDWNLYGNDKIFRTVKEVINDNLKVRLLAVSKGKDTRQSKSLCKELLINEHIEWFDELSKDQFRRLIKSADIVLDQFSTPGIIKSTAAMAMACEVPVVTSCEPAICLQCFDEKPPIIIANDQGRIQKSLSYYLSHSIELETIGKLSRQWALKHYSKAAVINKFESVIDRVSHELKNGKTPFNSLKQKRLEISYERDSAAIYDKKYHNSIVYKNMDDKLISLLKHHLCISGYNHPKVLDLGCGPASLTKKLLSIYEINLTGVDLSPSMVRLAKERYPDVDFYVEDAEALSFEDDYFDAVFCSGVLHHFSEITTCLKEVRRVLKPGGIFLIREPNDDNFASRFPQAAFAHLCLRHYIFNSLGEQEIEEPEAHEYHRSFNFSEVIDTIGKFFKIDHFDTDLMVSYFYSMFSDMENGVKLQNLDRTLAAIPGLNIIFVGKKTEETGLSKNVTKKMLTLEKNNSIGSEHYNQLLSYAKKQFKNTNANFYMELENCSSTNFNSKFWSMFIGKKMLFAGDDLKLCNKKAKEYRKNIETSLRKLSKTECKHHNLQKIEKIVKNWDNNVTVLNLDNMNFDNKKEYDAGFFFIKKKIPTKEFVNLFEYVKDYGFIYLKSKKKLNWNGADNKQIDYLRQINVLKSFGGILDQGHSICLSRYLFSPRDFYKAILVALDKELMNASSNSKGKYDNLYEKATIELKRFSKEFSALEKPYLISW